APLSNTTIDRYLRIYAIKAGVETIRQHDFRHRHASLLIANGISIVAVSKRLDHSTVSQTLDTYSHMMPSEEQQTIEVLDRIASIE
ncbi:MAG: tyrosine-type recombinase/integrase, partial [Clostridiales bacterium]|nr:tyrosine-type recombinase/integrase [Clostridiales bacterium]